MLTETLFSDTIFREVFKMGPEFKNFYKDG